MKRLFKRTASAVSTIEPPPSSKSARIDEGCAGDDDERVVNAEPARPAISKDEGLSNGNPQGLRKAPTSLLAKENVVKGKKNKGKQKAQVEDEEGIEDDKLKIKVLQREFQKSARRAARRQAAIDNPNVSAEQRRLIGLSRSDMVADVWVHEFLLWCELGTRLQQSFEGSTSNRDLVQKLVTSYADFHNHTPIPSTVWHSFSNEHFDLLADVARNSLYWDPSSFLQRGIVIKSDPDDPPLNDVVENYFRHIQPSVESPFEPYLLDFPADAPFTMMQTLLREGDVQHMSSSWRSQMVEIRLEGAVDKLIIEVANNLSAKRLRGERRPGLSSSVLYNGITQDVAPAARVENDIGMGSNVRVINFLDANKHKLQIDTYHIVGLDTPISDPMDVASNEVISWKERIIKAVCGIGSICSSHGGVQAINRPTLEQISLRDAALPASERHLFPLGTYEDMQLSEQVKALMDDEIRVLSPYDFPKIAPAAINAVKAKVVQPLRTLGGKVVKMEVTKDIPLQAFTARCGGYWDSTVGRGPEEDRHLRHFFHPELPESGDLPATLIARYIGSFADFWRLTLLHLLLFLIQLIFMSRLLERLSPILIVTQSNPVAAIFRSGLLVDGWTHLSSDDERAVDSCQTPLGLPGSLPSVRYPRFSGGEFNAVLGTIRIIRTGREPHHLSLVSFPSRCELNID
ncbi:hypothetical protein C8J57DRAFT_1490668 [Mycena rebaudengoi]|nr:hypothetical protein C8J57DRAFT_1490668 [Mycena rebaudengoi]